MSENDRDVAATLAALTSRGCHVSRDWLTDCVNFFRSENNQYSLKDLENFVYDQWLLGDLREIAGSGSLPPNLSNIAKTTLEGKMACQIESFTDIGHSAYNQMQKVRNEDVGNSQIDENKEFQQAWEPKSNRCLQFTICDGVQTIKAIEYKFLSFFKTDMMPGIKILLRGPIECRRGVLLLEEKHVTILGGEVDALAIVNAYENVLARKLNVPENPDPFKFTAPQIQHQQPPQPHPPQAQQHRQQQQPPFQANQRPLTGNNADYRGQQNQPPRARAPQQSKKLMQSTLSWSKQPRPPEANPPQIPSIEFTGDDEDFMNIPLDAEDWAEEMNYASEGRKPEERTSAKGSSTEVWGARDTIKPSSATSTAEVLVDEFDECDEALLLQAVASSSPILDQDEAFKPNSFAQKTLSSSVVLQVERAIEGNGSSKRSASSALHEECLRKPLFAKRRKETSSQEVTSSTDLDFIIDENFLDTSDSPETSNPIPIRLPPQPFVYLSQIDQSKVSNVYRVKAAVITVVEKLSISQNEWKLSAKITDGSANVHVKFSNKVLEELFGMTAIAMNELKKQIPQQPEKKEIIKKKLEKAQYRLINLNCLLDLKMCGTELPLVVGVEDISSSTVSTLSTRRAVSKS